MNVLRMNKLIKQIRGVSYKPEDLHDTLNEHSVILLRANNIANGLINFDDVLYVDRKKVSNEQILQRGDVLICASSGSKNLVGKAAPVDFEKEATFGAFCKAVRPINWDDADYIAMFFQSSFYRREISSVAIGVNINNIRNEHIDALSLNWPDSMERNRAVAIISKINSIIRSKKTEIEKMDELIKARFVEMFGDPVDNNFGWKTISLDEACDGVGDGLHGTPEYDDDGEYPFINGNNLINGSIEITPATKHVNRETYKKHFIEISDNAILISINGTLGKLAFYKGEEVMLGKSACYCNLKPEINRVFVYGVMKSDAFAQFLYENSTASTIKNVGLKAMRNYRLIMPPEDLQNTFIDFAKQVDKSKVA